MNYEYLAAGALVIMIFASGGVFGMALMFSLRSSKEKGQ